MRRQPIESKTKGTRVQSREGSRGAAAKRSQLRRLALEGLEARTLMATAPLPIVTGQTQLTSQTSTQSDDSSPWVAVDPVNPLKMVMAFTHRDPSGGTLTPITAGARFTVNGGQSWQTLNMPGNMGDPSVTTGAPYTQGFAQGAGFGVDGSGNQFVYVGVLENDNGNTSGAVIVDRFTFNTNTPTARVQTIVRQWNRSDPNVTNAALEPAVLNFSLAVDSGVASFTDPRSHVTQLDPNAGDVYVAMTVDTPPPSPAPPVWNRETIAINASTDGINWAVPNSPFNAGATVGGTSNGSFEHDTDPKIAVSQGKAGGTDGGLVTVIWDDFGSFSTASPPEDGIWDSAVTFNSGAKSFTSTGRTLITTTFVTGALDAQGTPSPYSRATPSSLLGIGPGAEVAVDNTLGSFSQFQGRIYVTYVDRPLFNAPNNPTDNTDIFLVSSDDDGRSWSSPVQVNDDDSTIDGHSSAVTSADQQNGYAVFIQGRPQYMPSIAVDPATGTVGLSWFDVRDDPSLARYATYVTTSIDGGQTFSPQTFANTPIAPINAITGLPTVFGPLADNQSAGTGSAETNLSFGQHQALIFANGALRPFWASDNDAEGTTSGTNTRLTIETASVTYTAGPRVISSTMGPVTSTTVDGLTFNNTFSAADHTPQIDGFAITFDRPVDVTSMEALVATQIQVFFNSPTSLTNTSIAVGSVSPLDSVFNGVEATTFFVRFATPQSAVGTYSYQIGNYPTAGSVGIQDDIWNRAGTAGNKMDQNANGVPGQSSDPFFAPMPLNPSIPGPPFDTTTLPLIVPGPSVVSTFVPNPANGLPLSSGSDNLVLNAPVSALDVTFDRNMMPANFTGTLGSGVVTITGPNGPVTGTFTFAPDPQPGENMSFPRTFRITFPSQSLSGTYSVVINPSSQILSESGVEVDANQNAGIPLLFDEGTGFSTTNLYQATNPTTGTTILGATIPVNGSVSSSITVADNYLIQSLLLTLNITYPHDPDLVATLQPPTGPPITLFSNVGNVGAVNTQHDFTNTTFTSLPTTPTGLPTPPITSGAPPFFGQFLPTNVALFADLVGTNVQGTWTLTITNTGTTPASTGTLNAWSLTAGQAINLSSGLGEPVSDRTSTSFRIFTMDPTNPLSSGTFTAVGPAAINNNDNAGQVSVVTIDPADPSGNTAYVGGAAGGVWKTTDFLTTSPNGPTYVPLTDNGPTNSLNIGSIAIFDRGGDPNQSIILVGTGDGDLFNSDGRHGSSAGSVGAGFLISMDAGKSWTVLDSLTNYNASGQEIPEAQRDKTFVGATTYKVLIDPKLSPSNQLIFYAAISSPTAGVGGIYRSLDSGHTWVNVRPGNATDVTFDPNSDVINAVSNPTGNIRALYAAFTGDGIYTTTNQGQTWSSMTGGVGDPLLREILSTVGIPVTNNPTPSGANGRITLAKPALIFTNGVRDPLLNTEFETWLYAAVSNANGNGFNGLYLTKDNGLNWTQVQLPDAAINYINGSPSEVVPTNNNTGANNYNVTRTEGTYTLSMAIDPTNPNIVYLGGTLEGQDTSLIRVDTSRLADPYSLTVDTSRKGGQSLDTGTDPVTTRTVANNDFSPFLDPPDPLFNPFINLYRNPGNPFATSSTIVVSDVNSFTNSGSGAYWTPFDSFLTYFDTNGNPQFAEDVHSLEAIVDPTTGKTRLIVGTDEGVYTAVDDGTGAVVPTTASGALTVATGSRNGNLQLAEMYNGAAQPSAAAAATGGALFYGITSDNGLVQSDPNILTNGNLQWTGDLGTGTDVNTDQTGSGTAYVSDWPINVGTGNSQTTTDFFQVNPSGQGFVSRTFTLIQGNNGTDIPDPQWPAFPSFNFAVNPVNNQDMIIGSGAGRLFITENQGAIWLPLAQPSVFDGTTLPALAYGAPDPNGPIGVGALDNYILVGTSGGKIFATFTGGSAVAGNPAWLQISGGLDGSSVEQIVTDPTRGTHDAYAVTTTGVFYNANTAAAGSTWVNITGGLFNLTINPFGNTNLTQTALAKGGLDAIAVDWRYVIPNNPSVPNGPTHPMIYVGGNGGIFRTTDNGVDWSAFPDATLNPDAATDPTASLPNADITGLSLVLGNVDPTTGHPDVSTGPNILMVSTYGRGAYALRLAPIVFNDAVNTVALSPTLPPPSGSDSGSSSTDKITNVTKPVITGLSEQTAFGNQVAITIMDVTNPAAPFLVGGFDPTTGVGSPSFTAAGNETNAFGQFSIQLDYSHPGTPFAFDGLRTLQIFATDASGTKGNVVNFQFTLITRPPLAPGVPLLEAGSDSGFSQSDNYTNNTAPFFDVPIPPPVEPGATLSQLILYRKPASDPNRVIGVDYIQVGQAVIPAGYTKATLPVQDASGTLGNGQYTYAAVAIDLAGNVGALSADSAVITVDTIAPLTPSAPALDPASDSGTKGDGITNVKNPTFDVTTTEFAPTRTVLLRGTKSDGSNAVAVNTIIGTSTNQKITDMTPGGVPDGTYFYFAQQIDLAGNVSPLSPGTQVQILTKIPGGTVAPTINVYPADLSGGAGSNVTNKQNPRFFGTAPPAPPTGQPLFLDVLVTSFTIGGITTTPATPITVYTGADPTSGNYLVQSSGLTLPAGVTTETFTLITQVRDLAGNTDPSSTLTLTITTAAPTVTPSLQIYGPDAYPAMPAAAVISGSGSTVLRRPRLVGVTDPNVTVSIVAVSSPTVVLATTRSGSNGYYVAQLPNNLTDGTITLAAFSTNAAGNSTPLSKPFTLTVTSVKGDYNADGIADLGVYTPPPLAGAQGLWTIGLLGTTTTTSRFYGLPGDLPIPGDYDGDGATDVAVFRPSTAQWIISQTTAGPEVISYGAPGKDTPVPAGYDVNGQYDIAVYTSAIGEWSILHNGSTGLTQTHTFFGFGLLDLPVPADYEGIGHAELAVYRPANSSPTAHDAGNWYVLNPTTGTTDAVVNLGFQAGDIPVPADYDAIGRAEPAIYRPSTGQFIVFNPIARKIETYTIPGATPASIPVPEDYNGSGHIDPAIFNQSTGTWRLLTPTATGFSTTAVVINFAVTFKDIPLPAPFASVASMIGSGGGVTGSGGAGGGGGVSNAIAGGSGSGGSGGSTNALSTGGSGSGSGGSRQVVVGAAIPGGSTSTGKTSSRPNVAISTTSTLLTTTVTKPPAQSTPSDQALSSLGRSINGKFI